MPRRAIWLALATLAALVAVLSIGRGGDPIGSILILPQIGQWAAPALAYLAAAVGYGILLSRLVGGSRDPAPLAIALGIGAIATLSQIAGCLGLLTGPVVAAALLAPGWSILVLYLWRQRKRRIELAPPGLTAWLCLVPLAVLIAAASAPPGWLWDSEYAGFDALSYHLRLPQEWLIGGHLEPQQHNVYSYLPGSFEAGVLHLAALTGAPRALDSDVHTGGVGLLAGTGWRAISAQYLHAAFTLLAAWLVGRAGRAVVGLSGGSESLGRDAGRLAGALALCTPWSVVVGSLAYNEMAVVALGAAALIAAVDSGLPAWRRALVTGLLVGAACGFKPTALTMLAPGLGIALLASAKPRFWPAMLLSGSLGGLAMLAPWMLRNLLAGGNPLFPMATSVFGSAHWTAEQVARYQAGHSFPGTVLDRLAMLIAPDPAAGPGARAVERWRGLFNPQFAALFPAAIGALLALQLPRNRCLRRPALLVSLMLGLGVLAWLATTHLQARFLIPLTIPACVLVGMALASPGSNQDKNARASIDRLAPIRRTIAGLLIAAQCVVLLAIFSTQRNGGPNEATAAGASLFTGEFLIDPRESVAGSINRALPPHSRVYLLGDAAPFYLSADVLWNTTWDDWPLGRAIRANPDADPAVWTAGLRARGVTHVLVNFAELSRYQRSGWADPDVTPQRVAAWVGTLGEPMAAWDGSGQALFTLPTTTPSTTTLPPTTPPRAQNE